MANCGDQRADLGNAQQHAFPGAPALFGREPVRTEKIADHDHRPDEQAVVADDVADLDDHLRDQGQFRVEALEDELETRDEEHEQKHDHGQRQHEQDGGIHHGRQHLGLELLFPRLEVGDLREDHVEESARLAGLDHGHVNPGKRLRGARHRLGQGDAVDHEIVEFLPFGLGHGRGGFAMQNHQRPAERHPGGQQARQQPGEILQRPRRDLPRAAERQLLRQERRDRLLQTGAVRAGVLAPATSCARPVCPDRNHCRPRRAGWVSARDLPSGAGPRAGRWRPGRPRRARHRAEWLCRRTAAWKLAYPETKSRNASRARSRRRRRNRGARPRSRPGPSSRVHAPW